jgi:hypothetical protein
MRVSSRAARLPSVAAEGRPLHEADLLLHLSERAMQGNRSALQVVRHDPDAGAVGDHRGRPPVAGARASGRGEDAEGDEDEGEDGEGADGEGADEEGAPGRQVGSNRRRW